MAWNEVKAPSITGKPKIAICTPHKEEASWEFFHTTYGPLLFREVPWCDKMPIARRGRPIAVDRNDMVEAALEAGCTHVFWLDSDHICEGDVNEALQILYQWDEPIVTGLYRAKKQGGLYPYNIWKKLKGQEGYSPVQAWTEGTTSFQVDVAGIGNTLIKREVFEKVPKPWFKWDKPTPSEDFYFFEKCAEHGFKVIVCTLVKFSHIGLLKVLASGEIKPLEA